MIRNESTSQLIASKNGDRDELLKLASRLMDRFIEDITPAIAGAVNNSNLPAGVIEMAITSELSIRAYRRHFGIKRLKEVVCDIWDGEEGYQEEIMKIIEELKELRK